MTPGPKAWHEAGHAIVAHVLGGAVRLVTLESDLDGHEGHVEVAWVNLKGRALARACVGVALAGPLSELAFRGELEEPDPSVLASWEGDWRTAQAELACAEPDEAKREPLLAVIVSEVRELLGRPAVLERVARVADALDAHETLDETLFEDCLG